MKNVLFITTGLYVLIASACASTQSSRPVSQEAVAAEQEEGDKDSIALSIMKHVKRDKGLRDVEVETDNALNTAPDNIDAAFSVGLALTDPNPLASTGWLIDALFLSTGFPRRVINWQFVPLEAASNEADAVEYTEGVIYPLLKESLQALGYSTKQSATSKGYKAYIITGNDCPESRPCMVALHSAVNTAWGVEDNAPMVIGGYRTHQINTYFSNDMKASYPWPKNLMAPLHMELSTRAPLWFVTYLPPEAMEKGGPAMVLQGGKRHYFLKPKS